MSSYEKYKKFMNFKLPRPAKQQHKSPSLTARLIYKNFDAEMYSDMRQFFIQP